MGQQELIEALQTALFDSGIVADLKRLADATDRIAAALETLATAADHRERAEGVGR